MYGLFLILAVFGASAADEESQGHVGMRPPPHYVQSSEGFTHINIYLQTRLPNKEVNLTDATDRLYHSFGLLAGVIGELTVTCGGIWYNPIASFERMIPNDWENYTHYADLSSKLLEEAYADLKPIINFINEELADSETIDEYNRDVDELVRSQPEIYAERAYLLLAFSKLANTLAPLTGVFDDVRVDYKTVPFLLHNVRGNEISNLVNKLSDVYQSLLRLRSKS